MLSFLYGSAEAFASSFLQFAVGLAAALLLRLPAVDRVLRRIGSVPGPSAAAVLLAASVIGCILPLGPAGAVPIAAAALALGIGAPLAVSFLLANLLFNMLAPFADPTFVWRSGCFRVAFALVAGSLGGLLALRDRKGAKLWFRPGALPAVDGAVTESLAPKILASLCFGAAFLALGSLVDLAFKRYALGAIMAFAYSSPAVSFVPEFFATRNVVNPLFLQAMRIIALLTDFSALAALALILRPRGILRYLAYLAAWAILLGLSAFMKV